MTNPFKMTPDDRRKKIEDELNYKQSVKTAIISALVVLVAGAIVLAIMFTLTKEALTWMK